MTSVKKLNPWLPEKWDFEEDVVIVGYGGAGASAAIASHDAGVKAVVLEKAPVGGGNTATAGPGFSVPADVDKGIEYYRALTFGTVDEELIRTLVETIHGIPGWLEKLGSKPRLIKQKPWHPSLPGSDGFRMMKFPPTPRKAGQKPGNIPGDWIFQFLNNKVKERRVEVLYEFPATGLIQDPLTKEIVGVRAKDSSRKVIYVKARRGVILACGGFENNREMLTQFMPFSVKLPIYPMGTPYNTGDGVYMATEVGAQLWHMTSVELGNFAPKAPSEKFGMGFRLIRQMPRRGTAIYVNKYGKRFMDESVLLSHSREFFKVQHFDGEQAEFPNIPFFMIFDEIYRRRGPIVGRSDSWWNYQNIYNWSQDNSAEIKQGWIVSAETVGELAEKIEVPPKALEETVNRYNRICSQQKDADFGRDKDWLVPVETPPFYATELCEPIINTQGGPKHNAHAQVLDKGNRPIPRLYAAGELGSIYFPLYLIGGNMAEALASGRIAGEQAAALTSWA